MKKYAQDLSFRTVILYALLAELGLLAIQVIYLLLHNVVSETQFGFNATFIRGYGFYVFLAIGFFVFIWLAYYVLRRIQTNWFLKLIAMFIAGSLFEILFYLLMLQSSFAGPYLYSVLDKFLGIIFGIVLYYIALPKSTRLT